MPPKAEKYIKLVGATMTDTAKDGYVVRFSVWLDCVPTRAVLFWFPIAHVRNYGPGQLFAAEWIIEKRNTYLKNSGESARIKVDVEAGFLA